MTRTTTIIVHFAATSSTIASSSLAEKPKVVGAFTIDLALDFPLQFTNFGTAEALLDHFLNYGSNHLLHLKKFDIERYKGFSLEGRVKDGTAIVIPHQALEATPNKQLRKLLRLSAEEIELKLVAKEEQDHDNNFDTSAKVDQLEAQLRAMQLELGEANGKLEEANAKSYMLEEVNSNLQEALSITQANLRLKDTEATAAKEELVQVKEGKVVLEDLVGHQAARLGVFTSNTPVNPNTNVIGGGRHFTRRQAQKLGRLQIQCETQEAGLEVLCEENKGLRAKLKALKDQTEAQTKIQGIWSEMLTKANAKCSVGGLHEADNVPKKTRRKKKSAKTTKRASKLVWSWFSAARELLPATFLCHRAIKF